MDEKKTGGRRVGGAGIVLGLALALALAGAVVWGLHTWGRGHTVQPSETEPGPPQASSLSVYVPEDPYTAPEPEDPSGSTAQETGTLLDGYEYDEILAQEEGFLLARIQGKRYLGYLAVVEDPFRVTVATSGWFSEDSYGKRVDEMAEAAGAILAVNGGGFSDPGGNGKGGMPVGNVVVDGALLWGEYSHTVGLDAQGVLHVGTFTGQECVNMGLQWALSYGPTLISNGQIQTFNNSLQEPRTAIAQREDGAILLICLQGRQVSALGVTLQELSEILLSYGAVNASNLDGGASSDMYYNGDYVNISNSAGGPRPLPTSVIVLPAGGQEGEE